LSVVRGLQILSVCPTVLTFLKAFNRYSGIALIDLSINGQYYLPEIIIIAFCLFAEHTFLEISLQKKLMSSSSIFCLTIYLFSFIALFLDSLVVLSLIPHNHIL
jgi:hypothetical protein